MVTLDNYSDGFMGGDGQADLIKAIQAGQITGRDTTGLSLTAEPLKAEALDKTLKLLDFRLQDIKLLNAIPKVATFNTVDEFLQLSSYGSERGGFYNEGELSDVEDSTYIRRSELVKYMQVTGEVTMQAQITKSFINIYQQEVENKMMWLSRLADRALTKADSDIISQEFNSIYKQHALIGSGEAFLYATFEDYYNSGTVIDLRGDSLKQEDVEAGALAVDAHYGTADTLFAPTSVISGFTQDYYARQRIMFGGGSNSAYSGTIGTPIKKVATSVGDIDLLNDKFMNADLSKYASAGATSQKAPAAPAISAVASQADPNGKYSGAELGNVYYAVSALNRYGESALTVFATAVTLTAAHGIDISVTPVGGATPTQGFIVYRTKVTAAGSAAGLEFFPVYRVSVAAVAGGHNGAGNGKTRDLGYFLPDTEQAFITAMNDQVLAFKQLAPMSKLDLAIFRCQDVSLYSNSPPLS
jgi:hypothetical protein